jgi:hypothetical protein
MRLVIPSRSEPMRTWRASGSNSPTGLRKAAETKPPKRIAKAKTMILCDADAPNFDVLAFLALKRK